jgi:ankyrin repeat protein
MIMKKSSELKIDLNIKDNNGNTALHIACLNGHSEIVEIIIKNSSELKIDLNSKEEGGWTAFHLACLIIIIIIIQT